VEWHFLSNLHQTILMHQNVFRKTALPEEVRRGRLFIPRRKCLGAIRPTAAKIVLEPVLAVCCFTLSTKPALSARRVCHDDMVSRIDFGHFGASFSASHDPANDHFFYAVASILEGIMAATSSPLRPTFIAGLSGLNSLSYSLHFELLHRNSYRGVDHGQCRRLPRASS
jgi:hypothetical protein